MDLGEEAMELKAILDKMPGAICDPYFPSRAKEPLCLMYKIMGKLFAVLAARPVEYVVLKCDPFLAEILREKYASIGHRSHLDNRNWISVDLNASVPHVELKNLVENSYDLVRASLTRKQQAEFETLIGRN
jgi:predicted DNA-binding protein (MmcQ/YjbR family)